MIITWHTRFSFLRSARDLENEHLRAQIDDAARCVDLVLAGGRPSEPAYYLWKDSLAALLIMGMAASMEWTFHRGYDDRTFWKFSRLADEMSGKGAFTYEPPAWFRDEAVVMSHRSALISRFGEPYAEAWPTAPQEMPLLWLDPGAKDGAVANLRLSQEDLKAVRAKKLTVPAKYRDRVVNL